MAHKNDDSSTNPSSTNSSSGGDAASGKHPAPFDEDAEEGAGLRGAWIVLFGLAALLLVATRLWRLTDSCLWFDEIFSVHAARYDLYAMLNFVAQDLIHPPLFYILLKAWMASGGESLAWLRLFPALASVATVVPFLLLCRELRLKADETTLALALMALNGYLIKYAQEVRMYSLLLLLAFCSLWLFARYYNAHTNARKELLALFAANLLLVYTHYFGWLLVASEFVFLLVFAARGKWRMFLIKTTALLVCFSPWVYAVLTRAANAGTGAGLRQNIGWMSRPGLRAVAQFYVTLQEILYYPQSNNEPLFQRWSAPLGLLLFVCPVVLLIIRHVLRRRAPFDTQTETHATENAATLSTRHAETPEIHRATTLSWLLLFSLLPSAFAFLASWFLPYSVWGARHLIIVAPSYLIVVAVALCRLRPVWLRTSMLVMLGCWTVASASALAVRREGNYIWCAWETLARRLPEAERAGGEPVSVYVFEDLVAYHAWFALSRMEADGFRVEVVKGIDGLMEDPAYFLPRGFDEIATNSNGAEAFVDEHFWIAFRDTAWKPESQPLKMLRERGYEIGQIFHVEAQGQKAFLVAVRRKK
ncbi:MAG TPA: glycosyltransferase family 39 protein [Pyrinomonadaceae bacterium]|jgi:uncharacterized membrane protein